MDMRLAVGDRKDPFSFAKISPVQAGKRGEKMKRIVMLSVHSCPMAALGGKETGGMNVYVRELSRQMGQLGVQVDIFTRSQNPHISRVVSLGRNVRVIHIAAGPEEPISKYELLPYMPEFGNQVIEFVKKERISYEVIHSHYWVSGHVGERLKRLWAIPLVHMFHTLGAMKNSVSRGSGSREPKTRLRVEEEIARSADLLIVSSPWEKEQIIRHTRANPSRVKVIPCGVDLTLFKPIQPERAMAALRLFRKEFILFVGRIDAVKGIDVLIRAIHHLTCKSKAERYPLGLIVIGGELDADPQKETEEMQRLRKLVARLKLQDRVAFWGAQPQNLLPYFYSAAQALVLPSRYESFGMVALEAMACGTPVIGSRVGGLQYAIEEGRTGLLVAEGDWLELAHRICDVIENHSLKKKLVRGALAKVKQFGWPGIAKQVLATYVSLGMG
jgi:D-inositol-3-phosphate glycosyltransferase